MQCHWDENEFFSWKLIRINYYQFLDIQLNLTSLIDCDRNKTTLTKYLPRVKYELGREWNIIFFAMLHFHVIFHDRREILLNKLKTNFFSLPNMLYKLNVFFSHKLWSDWFQGPDQVLDNKNIIHLLSFRLKLCFSFIAWKIVFHSLSY